MVTPKIIIVTQARVGSSRFPGKVLQRVDDKDTLLSLHLKRLKKSRLAGKIIVATTFEEKACGIIDIALQENVSVFQGSTNDVLDRFYNAVKADAPDYIVRVTSDCPLIDAALIDSIIRMVVDKRLDYGANILKEQFPDGQDVEVFTFKALAKAWKEASLNSDREHVTPYIRKNSTYNGGDMFRSDNYSFQVNMNHVRMTVDEPADLYTIKTLLEQLGPDAGWEVYANYIVDSANLFSNQQIKRNAGYERSLKND